MRVEALDLIPHFAFWRDGCRTFGAAILMTLKQAGESPTIHNVRRFVRHLPRCAKDLESDIWQRNYCSLCLKTAWENSPTDESFVVDYFTKYFLDRNWACQEMLIDAFIAILELLDRVEESEKEGE